ncbi:MAG: hypothetical protein QGH57_01655 [Candidatus Thalassarchaeaceae archaeon]|nr:hypothetical protein [Candidatus Thalassarchaeaceae archaeon]MDP7256723.1 hypothetical protein [Candidatus Thalassarchaeaceae archaeon]MDP7649396.1 hypothetical protein [Candidatus Thalassarchaeaceae archaeon]HJL55057.1 hypothetical protein [Candidatus Thalassarchaeaceae archaeon]HJM77196.1 hypothetical protein [Candidatus Thalassarchaeaceae archaeon]
MIDMLAKSFPTRAPVYWEVVESGQVVIMHEKSLSGFELLLSNLMRAPKSIQRTLDEMNSLLWNLMDGNNNLAEIVVRMDLAFAEKIAPVNERVALSIKSFLNLGLAVIIVQPEELKWDTGPCVNHPSESLGA